MALLKAGKWIAKSVGLIIAPGWEITYREKTMTLLLSAVLSELPIPSEDRLTSTTHNPAGLKCFNMCSVTVEKDVNCGKQEIAALMWATAGTIVPFPFFFTTHSSLCVFRNRILHPKLRTGLFHSTQHMAADVWQCVRSGREEGRRQKKWDWGRERPKGTGGEGKGTVGGGKEKDDDSKERETGRKGIHADMTT